MSPSSAPAAVSHSPRSHRLTIASLALISRLVPWLLLHLLSAINLPQFDSSAQLLAPSAATLRWDAIHFAAIAQEGYKYEQQIAFQPGWPGLLRFGAWATGRAGDVGRIIRVGEVLAGASYIGAVVMLYDLTALLFSRQFAYSAALLYLLAPAPAVLSSAYSEPLFALLTFAGFYLVLQKRIYLASVLLAGATSIRATGILAVGAVVWLQVFRERPLYDILKSPGILIRRALGCCIPAAIIVSPFVLSQVYFYHALCIGDATREAWCSRRIPMAYSHVQAKYWNVGLLNYWTPAQIPNILLASPVLYVTFLGAYRFFRSYLPSLPSSSLRPTPSAPHRTTLVLPFGRNPNILLPFYIHSTALALLLLFSAHTQIALRVCMTDPVVWWSLTELAFKWGPKPGHVPHLGLGRMTRLGKAWVWWVVVYGAVSIVLWAGHYPPA